MTLSRATATGLTTFAMATALMASTAFAGGFALREQSTYGLGMAFAGIAAGGSLSSQFWNPATLGEVNGFVYETDLSGILPLVNVYLKASPVPTPAQDQGNIGIGAVVPATYLGYRVSPNVILGLAINSPFGLATKYDSTSFVRAVGVAGTSRVFTINANPNIAYQFNDQLTVAAGLQVQYFEIRETAFAKSTGTYKGRSKDLGLGFTLGAEWKPQKGTTIGLGYRSGITNSVDGTLSGLPTGASPSVDGHLSVKTPGVLTLGIAQALTDQWTVRGGVEFTNWSVLGTVPVTGTAKNIIGTGIPFKYKDSWYLSAGAGYKYSPDLTLRGGVGYEIAPNVDSNRSFRLPDSDRIWLSSGLSYTPASWYAIDVGYSFIHGFGSKLNASPTYGGTGPTTNGPLSATYDSNVHILSAAFKVKFGS